MAEINIQRTERSWWPWLLGAIAVAAVVWFIASQNAAPTTASYNRADSTRMRDSAAGTLAPSRDSMMRRDSMQMNRPR